MPTPSIAGASSHGGILLPLDMFRPTMLAAALAEGLVSRAKNILDARLTLTRHPSVQLLLGRIEGSVVGDDPAEFWREQADLAMLASHVVPRQVFLYYAHPGPGPDRREGFIVAQRGQVLAADEATPDKLPPGATDDDWPLPRLCAQMMIHVEDLADGFPGGPRIELSLVEPSGDDQKLLMTLAGQPPEDDEGGPGAAAPGDAEAAPPKPTVESDLKRREAEHAAEAVQREQRATEVASGLAYVVDDLGVIVAPQAELSEHHVLAPLSVAKLTGDVPEGLPGDLASSLQGKRVDFVVPVEFFSEVLVENTPLSRAAFEERAAPVKIGDVEVEAAEVLAPRLGYGTLLRLGTGRAFVSRKAGMPLPEQLVIDVLRSQA